MSLHQCISLFLREATGEGDTQPAQANDIKIAADNKGHQLLRKMGWSAEVAIGGNQDTAPSRVVTAQEMMRKAQQGGSTLGVGSGTATHEVKASDDIYEQYKVRGNSLIVY